jgi:hypothetical protein
MSLLLKVQGCRSTMAPPTQKGEAPMPVVQVHEIAGMTREQYEQGMRELNLSGPPPGSHLHASGPMDGGWRIIEVWESEEAATAFYGSEPFRQMSRRLGNLPSVKVASYPVETVRT